MTDTLKMKTTATTVDNNDNNNLTFKHTLQNMNTKLQTQMFEPTIVQLTFHLTTSSSTHLKALS